jgi:hypothetical protein
MNGFLLIRSKYADFIDHSQCKKYGYFIRFYLLFYFALTAFSSVSGLLAGVTRSGIFAELFSLRVLRPSTTKFYD